MDVTIEIAIRIEPMPRFIVGSESGLPARQVLQVLFVFVADVLQQLSVSQQLHPEGHRPRLGVGFRVVDSELNIEMPEVAPLEPLCDVQGVSRWMTCEVEPRFAIES